MKREPSTASRALRSVSLVITLVSVVTFSTMGYSIYADLSGVLSTLGSGGQGPAARFTVNGTGGELNLAFSVKNAGLYPLLISLNCRPNASLTASCSGANVTIPAGETRQVSLTVSVADLTKVLSVVSSGRQVHLDATAQASLEPFATLSAEFDLGNTLSGAVR